MVETDWFTRLIIVFILINTIFLASEHYMMPNWLKSASEYANYILIFIFFLEMILKMFGLGIKHYVMDGFNLFDCIVVLISISELF